MNPPNPLTWEYLILLTMPFSDELIEWCNIHPEFQKALKVVASDRFLHLGGAMITKPRNSADKVIGVFVYDYLATPSIFKQDFIVSVGGLDKEFILYTGYKIPGGSTKYVKHIHEFMEKYGKDGDYSNTHHLSFDQLPDELKENGLAMIERAKDLPKDILNPPYSMMKDFYKQIMAERQKQKVR